MGYLLKLMAALSAQAIPLIKDKTSSFYIRKIICELNALNKIHHAIDEHLIDNLNEIVLSYT